MFEAQAIAIEMENLSPTRPLTHDLFASFAKSFDFTVTEIVISEIQEGIFYSKIYCSDGDVRQKSIDARPSDAVAIALRFNAPIYTNDKVLSVAGISAWEIEQESQEKQRDIKVTDKKSDNLSGLSIDELQKRLSAAISKEEYENAAKIRDEIEKRN